MLLTSFNLQASIFILLLFLLMYIGGFYLLYKIYLEKIIEEMAAKESKSKTALLIQFYIMYVLFISIIGFI